MSKLHTYMISIHTNIRFRRLIFLKNMKVYICGLCLKIYVLSGNAFGLKAREQGGHRIITEILLFFLLGFFCVSFSGILVTTTEIQRNSSPGMWKKNLILSLSILHQIQNILQCEQHFFLLIVSLKTEMSIQSFHSFCWASGRIVLPKPTDSMVVYPLTFLGEESSSYYHLIRIWAKN